MPLNRREESELALYEYLLGLRELGLGHQATRIFDRYRVQEIRPLHLKVKSLTRRCDLMDRAPTQEELNEIEDKWASSFERCLEELKALWLTEGQTERGA